MTKTTPTGTVEEASALHTMNNISATLVRVR